MDASQHLMDFSQIARTQLHSSRHTKLIIAWGNADRFFKQPAEIGFVLVAQLGRNLLHCAQGIAQETLRLKNDAGPNPFARRKTRRTTNGRRQMIRIHAETRGIGGGAFFRTEIPFQHGAETLVKSGVRIERRFDRKAAAHIFLQTLHDEVKQKPQSRDRMVGPAGPFTRQIIEECSEHGIMSLVEPQKRRPVPLKKRRSTQRMLVRECLDEKCFTETQRKAAIRFGPPTAGVNLLGWNEKCRAWTDPK